jgi:dihydroneopterin aldolase
MRIFTSGIMDKTGILELEGMEFRANHGCLERERIAGNDFIVDFRGDVDMTAAMESDNLDDAVNYALIYNVVAREMAQPSDLLEHVAGRIMKALAAEFPQFVSFSVRVSKKRPPVDGIVQWSRITLTCHPERSEESL